MNDFNSAWLNEYNRKLNKNIDSRSGPYPIKEELSVPIKKRRAGDRQGCEVKNGENRKRYSVRVVFRVSDNRKRDAFGMLETIADAIIGAVGRFNQGGSGR